jgi:hypothetical protein
MGAPKESIVYIVVVARSGEVVARRYIERERLPEWLRRNGPSSARCDVFSDAPEQGGTRVAILRRQVCRQWLSA